MKFNNLLKSTLFGLLFVFCNNVWSQTGMGVGTSSPAEKLDVNGAVRIGTTTSTNAGTIRWTGTAFQGYDGTQWINLGGGTDSDWTISGNDQYSGVSGNVGIGTVLPGAKLHVNGSIRMVDGNQQVGYIPVGDANGTMSWANPDTMFNSPFIVNGNLVSSHPALVDYSSDDFVFGSPQLSDDGDANHFNRFFFDKSKGAFRAGTTTGDQWNDVNIGNSSFAGGYDVTASGDNSIAFGERTRATDDAAIALGTQAYAYGYRSYAFGDDVQATDTGAIAVGARSRAEGLYSLGIGYRVKATANHSVAIGFDATASDSGAVAFGRGTIANGEFSIAGGNSSAASGRNSVAFGTNNFAIGNSSVSLGSNSLAMGENSFAVGSRANATSQESMAAGFNVTSSGENAIALGNNVNALSAYETVLGRYNTAYAPNDVNGWNASDRLFTVGNGASSSSTSDAMVILKNGNTGIGTSSPVSQLHVEGSVQMVDGNQQVGYIPVSDANGKMAWTDPGTITTGNDGDWTINGNDLYSAVPGSVGIGTTAPLRKLNIASGSMMVSRVAGRKDGVEVFADGQAGNAGGQILFREDDNNDWGFRMGFNGGNATNSFNWPANTFNITRHNNNTTGVPVLTIPRTNDFVGIGTTAPTDRLHVNGSIRMTDGNEQAGYVAVSDANGKMTWTAPNSIDSDWIINGNDQYSAVSGNVGIGTVAPVAKLNLLEADESTSLSSFTQSLDDAGMLITSDYTNGAYTPGIFWNTTNDNSTKPKAGIFMQETSSGSKLLFGTSNAYATGLTNTSLVLDQKGNIGIGTATTEAKLHVYDVADGEQTGIKISQAGNNSLIYHDSNNSLILRKQSETNQLALGSNGNVGVGTATPSSKLHVNGSIKMVDGNQAIGYIPVSDANGKMTWTDPNSISTGDDGDWTVSGNDQYSTVSGNVGIGTTTPLRKLNIASGSMMISSVVGRKDGVEVIADGTAGNSGGQVLFRETDNDDWGFRLGFNGGNSTNSYNWPANTFNISRHDNNTTGMPVLTIPRTHDYVGIGTTNPTNRLHVHTGNIAITNPGGSPDGSSITLTSPNTNDVGMRIELGDGSGGVEQLWSMRVSSSNKDLQFASAGDPKMVIDEGGNVGIGGLNPVRPLNVVGHILSSPSDGVIRGIEIIPLAQANSGGRIFFREAETNAGGFSVGYNGSSNGAVLNWPENSFNISRHNGGNNGTICLSIQREEGNIGIGVTGAQERLHVGGSIRMVDGNQAAGYIPVSDASGTMTWTDPSTIGLGNDDDWTVSGNNQYSGVSGNVGIGTANPNEKLEVNGAIRMVDGFVAEGFMIYADANGTMHWDSPRNNVIRDTDTGSDTYTDDSYHTVVGPSSFNLQVTTGDIITVNAMASVRLTEGSGTDDFNYRVSYSGCATGNLETMTYRPSEGGSDHDNFTPLPYLWTMTAPCSGVLNFTYEIANTGDDDWQVQDRVIVVRKN